MTEAWGDIMELIQEEYEKAEEEREKAEAEREAAKREQKKKDKIAELAAVVCVLVLEVVNSQRRC